MDNNFGLTLIKMPANVISPGEEFANVSFEEFASYINNVKTYSDNEIIDILRTGNV
jgi:hypothetical protein